MGHPELSIIACPFSDVTATEEKHGDLVFDGGETGLGITTLVFQDGLFFFQKEELVAAMLLGAHGEVEPCDDVSVAPAEIAQLQGGRKEAEGLHSGALSEMSSQRYS
jgi:hypothetical protein